jgi:hypothetical protein
MHYARFKSELHSEELTFSSLSFDVSHFYIDLTYLVL